MFKKENTKTNVFKNFKNYLKNSKIFFEKKKTNYISV